MKFTKILLFGFVAFIAFGWFVGENQSPAQKARAEADRTLYDSKYTCQRFVERKLKAPSTAKFQSTGDTFAVKADDVYQVAGYVDAQNGFGAMIRSNYHCKMKLQGSKWILESVDI